MKKFITFISVFMLSLYSMGGMIIDRIYVTAPNGKVGSTAELTLNIDNSYTFGGWSCKVVLPEGIEFKKASLVSDRCSEDAVFNSVKASDGSRLLTCVNYDYEEYKTVNFTGSWGAVAKVKVSIPDNFKPGTYAIELQDCQLITSDGKTYNLDNYSFNWKIEGNGSGGGGTGTGNQVYMTGSNGKVGQNAELFLNIKNVDEFCGWSCRVTIPDGIVFKGASLAGNRCVENAFLDCRRATDVDDDDTWQTSGVNYDITLERVKLYNYTGNDGVVAKIKVSIPNDFNPGTYNIKLWRLSLSTLDGVSIPCDTTSMFLWKIEGEGSNPDPYTEVDTDISLLDNIIYLNKTESFVGQEKTLSFRMKNSAAIRGFQFDLYLPNGVTAVKNAKGRIQGGLSNGRLPEDDEHTLTLQEQPDGAIRFLCGSQYDETFTDNEGEIATLQVNVAEYLGDGDYPIVLKNMRLSQTDISKYYDTEQIKSTLTILSYTIGDINGDGIINVSDYIGVANHILGSTPTGFIEKAADVNEDNTINVSDYIGIANIILTGSPFGNGNGVKALVREEATDINAKGNVIYVEPMDVEAGTKTSLSLMMKNSAAIRGFQFDLYLPEGVTVVKNAKGRIQGSLSSGRLPEDDEHTLTIQEQADGAIRFLCGSQYDETFTGNNGEIATLQVNIAEGMASGEYPVVLKNMRLSETDISKFYDSDIVETTLTIKSGEKCATPTITYAYGKLKFNCDTEGVTFASTITDDDIKSYDTAEIDLVVTYTISVYATKDGCENSDVATATLCWIDAEPRTEGIDDAVLELKAMPVLIQTQGGTITVQGPEDGTHVNVYSANGMQQGSAEIVNGIAHISTSLQHGAVAIVKVGEKAVKIAIK